jgi:transcriptional regulator with XRE-family HTH domain
VSRKRDNIATNVKRLRLAKDLSQEDLGARCGLTGKTIYRIESRMTGPTWETVQLLAEALGVADVELTADPPTRA